MRDLYLELKFSERESLFYQTIYTFIYFLFQEQRSLKAANLSHQESNNLAASSMKLQSDSFSSEKVTLS